MADIYTTLSDIVAYGRTDDTGNRVVDIQRVDYGRNDDGRTTRIITEQIATITEADALTLLRSLAAVAGELVLHYHVQANTFRDYVIKETL